MEEMKWNELEEIYKNNFLILNLFFIFSFTFPLYFLFFYHIFPQIFRNQNIT